MPFEPPIIVPSSPQNTFTTLTQPYPVDDNGIWTGNKTQEESEQGLIFEVPIDPSHLNSPFAVDGEGHDQNVICRWVTPPCQTVGGANEPTYLDVGVMAFHYSKIDRVEFFLNGGTNPTVVRDVTYNPEKDISAYWVRIEAASLPDSGDAWSSVVSASGSNLGLATSPLVLSPQHELQAVVYPKNGPPRILVGKHSNGERGAEPLYSGIAAYTPVGASFSSLEQPSNGIRSFYFSSNNNNTLFVGSVYVDATFGEDDLNRSGDSAFPMQTIEFAYRKLMQLKFKFLNPTSTLIPKSQGDVGGGTIYLKDLGDGLNKFMGHKMGFKDVADTTIPSTIAKDSRGDITGGYPFKTLSMFRWLTIRPDPLVTDPLRAKIKGFHYQTRMRDILYATKGIPNTLTKYDGCVIELDYPYSEYLCGDGPDLSGDPTCAKLQENWVHPVKKGLASQGTWTRTLQGYAIIRLPEKRINGFISSSTAPVGFPKLAPYTWFNNCKLDGRERSRQNIYEWADALGLTHSTSFTPITDFNHPLLPETHRGVFRNDDTGSSTGTRATNGYPNELIPQVFVKSLIPMKGFSANAGYTFEFSFMSPESTSTNCDFTMQDRIQTFLINTHMKNIGEPAMVAADMSINCTYDCYDGDLIRGSLLLYNPHLINAMATKSYVNKSGASFFATHSDVWQPNAGEYSFRRKSVGINNVILHRINNPSPRSPRFDDPIARHGAIGTGRLLEHRFEGQFLYCGSGITDIDYKYPIEIGGDGLTWQMFGGRYLKDIAVSDCFVRTVDETEELVHRCVIENYLLFNTQIASIVTPFVLPMRNQGVGQSVVTRRYKEAVPSHPTLGSNADNSQIDEANFVHYNLASFDNFQYFSINRVNPLEFQDTHKENLHVYMVNPNNLASPVEVPLRMIPDAEGKRKLRENTQSLFSNLDYPFTKVNGEAGPNQIVGSDPNIAFIATSLDKTALNLANNPQPNSSTRGTWFVNNLPSTVDGAPYGWYPSDVPHENFLNSHRRSNIVVNGVITAGITGSVLSEKNIESGLISPQFLNKEILGRGGDPTFGGDGNSAGQRGFRNKVFYRYTNFDYDGTRTEFGEVLPRSTFIEDPSSGEGTESTSNETPDFAPINNHPISVRLTTTDMNGMNNAVDWMFKDSTINASHGVGGIYLPEDITKIPNILANIPEMTDPVRDNEGIGGSRSNEINGELGGGVFVNGGVADFTLNPLVGSVNTLDIRNIATLFMQKARVLGGVTMNLILHGKIIPSPALAEYKYVAAPPPASPEFPENNENIEGVHFDEFYRKYAYIAFNSREVPVQSITSNQISFRKGFHHGFTKWSKADLAGLSLSNGATGVSQIQVLNSSLWNTPHGLSFGALCTFDTLTTPVNETATAINTVNIPTTISCTNKTLRFVGIQNLTAHFQAVATKAFSLFSSGTFNHNGKIIASDPLFGFDDPNPVYTLTNQSSLSIRTQYAHTQGNKNLLGIKFASGATRLFDGISNIGIVVGSYVRISGSSVTSNNGIYQVLSIQNGIPNDINENTSLADGLSPFSYLELSRAITPVIEGSSIMIENVSHLPILHLRYRTS